MHKPIRTYLSAPTTLALLTLASAGTARASLLTDPNDARNWQGANVGTFAQLYFGANNAANRQQVIDKNLLDDGTFSFSGATPAQLIKALNTSGGGRSLDTTGTGAYDYDFPGISVTAAANTIDNTWIQTSGSVGDTVFDLGGPSTKAAVFPTIDHGPLPEEAIEATVYLSNDQVNWTQAVVERVWLEGFEPNQGILWDGFVYAVGTGTGATFRYASVIHGGPGALQHDGDNEINGIMGLDSNFRPHTVPELGNTLGLLTGAAFLLGVARRGRC